MAIVTREKLVTIKSPLNIKLARDQFLVRREMATKIKIGPTSARANSAVIDPIISGAEAKENSALNSSITPCCNNITHTTPLQISSKYLNPIKLYVICNYSPSILHHSSHLCSFTSWRST